MFGSPATTQPGRYGDDEAALLPLNTIRKWLTVLNSRRNYICNSFRGVIHPRHSISDIPPFSCKRATRVSQSLRYCWLAHFGQPPDPLPHASNFPISIIAQHEDALWLHKKKKNRSDTFFRARGYFQLNREMNSLQRDKDRSHYRNVVPIVSSPSACNLRLLTWASSHHLTR